MMGISAEEFPALPNFENNRAFELSQSAVVGMLKTVSYAQPTKIVTFKWCLL